MSKSDINPQIAQITQIGIYNLRNLWNLCIIFAASNDFDMALGALWPSLQLRKILAAPHHSLRIHVQYRAIGSAV